MARKTRLMLWALLAIILAVTGYFLFFTTPTADMDNKQSATTNTQANPGDNGNVLRRGNESEVQTLDPLLATGHVESRVIEDIFEGLIAQDPAGKLLPGLAEKWEISDDGTVYTFHLRDGLVWSDNTPITSDDVVYSWRRMLDPATAAQYSFMLYPVKNAKEINTGEIKDLTKLGITAVDAKTFKVELISSTPYFLDLLVHYSSFPIPKHVVEKHQVEWTKLENIVTSGAYKITEWVPQARIVLEKFDKYYGKDKVKIDKVIYYPTEDQSSELKRFRAGELDITAKVPPEQIEWVRENLKENLQEIPVLSTAYFGFNATKPPFKDNLKLRKALTLAIDRKVLVEKVIKSGVPAYSIVPPGVNNYDQQYIPDYAKLSDADRIAEAQKLFKEAGYSSENPLTIEILYNTAELNKKLSVAIAGMWQQVLGVNTTLTNQEWKVYLQTRRSKNTQVFRARWLGDYNDANTFLDMWLPQSDLNDVGFIDPEYTKLIYSAAKELNLEKRQKMLFQAEKIFIDSFHITPLFHATENFLINTKVKGWKPNVMDRYHSKDMYFVE